MLLYKLVMVVLKWKFLCVFLVLKANVSISVWFEAEITIWLRFTWNKQIIYIILIYVGIEHEQNWTRFGKLKREITGKLNKRKYRRISWTKPHRIASFRGIKRTRDEKKKQTFIKLSEFMSNFWYMQFLNVNVLVCCGWWAARIVVTQRHWRKERERESGRKRIQKLLSSEK